MPAVIVFSRTEKAQEFWRDPVNRDRLQNVLREYVSLPTSLAVEGNNFLVDHLSSEYPEDAKDEEPDILLRVEYSVREEGLVRTETGTDTFTALDTGEMLDVLKRAFLELVWGPWEIPHHHAGYSQG